MRVRFLLAALGIALLVPLLAALILFVRANGLTTSALALATLPALAALLCFALPRAAARARRALLAAAAALAALDAAYIAARLARPAATAPAVQYCEDGDCARRPPLLARLPDEGETALAGLQLSAALDFIGGEEQASLDALLRRDYARLAASPRYAGLPSAPLVEASGHVRTLQWIPPGRDRAPCLVFLHGFGGQLTLYLQSLIESGLGDDFVIVAPFLDPYGTWWSKEGEAVVRELVTRRLPPAADPEQVFLVGLSKGGMGASYLLQRPAMRRLFRGGVLISASGGPREEEPLDGLSLLLVMGEDDPRFPLDHAENDAAALRARGADVALEALPADHFLILSHTAALATRMRAWLTPRLRAAAEGER